MTGRSVWSRVGRLETARALRAGRCAVCGGGGYPGLFVQTEEEREPEQVGTTVCSGCGRVRMGALVVLPGGEGWAGDDEGVQR